MIFIKAVSIYRAAFFKGSILDHIEFEQMALRCAPAVNHKTLHYLVSVESSFNPYAIGIVGGHLTKQPKTLSEAVSTVQMLLKRGINFSAGITQVNRYNFEKYDLTIETVFDPCVNMGAGSKILKECFERASARMKGSEQENIQYALSCYYSGNFTTGFSHGYVQNIVKAAIRAKK
ncbi:lytic transglycosylase domain-containing protein [Janthinobacterium sp. MDT1-19]|uniref:lytic transglycosylase domain-containing protein n=1 Tax=Janthinobacterium sp. MDT1-19 TaxID=1259339 RepID=UPI003F2320E2